MQQLSLQSVRLWQFVVATFLVTQILFGVEGWICWIIPAVVAWATTRNQPIGAKDFRIAGAVWLFLMLMLYIGRNAAL